MVKLSIDPLDETTIIVKQPEEYNYLPSIPNRIAILAQSNSGKTVLIINMLLKVYLKKYDDIYIISHSINIDPAWKALKDKIPEANLMEEYSDDATRKIVERHLKIRELQKQNKKRRLGQLLIILDDIIDNHEIAYAKLDSILTTLFVRGRHSGISVWFSSQKYKTAIPRIIRLNCSHYIIFRLSQKSERDAILDEFSGLLSSETLHTIYDIATSEKYSFLYIDRTQHDLNQIFHKKFDINFQINE
jgi:hypothetical protein